MTTALGSVAEEGADLVAAAAAGDEFAFERLVAIHHEDLRRICHVVTGDPVAADEAVQAAWAIAWRKMGSLRDRSRIVPWLASIAINEARRAHRSSRRRSVLEIAVSLDAGSRARDADPAAGISAIDLRNTLARLSRDDRALLALRFVYEFDSPEIAAVLGISASGARSRLSRLLQRLQGELGND
jgi:RNA polymerase sigma-70 factor (ECF subfamily)